MDAAWSPSSGPPKLKIEIVSGDWLVADGEPDKVSEMMQDPGLASEMERAGVTGPPELFIAG